MLPEAEELLSAAAEEEEVADDDDGGAHAAPMVTCDVTTEVAAATATAMVDSAAGEGGSRSGRSIDADTARAQQEEGATAANDQDDTMPRKRAGGLVRAALQWRPCEVHCLVDVGPFVHPSGSADERLRTTPDDANH